MRDVLREEMHVFVHGTVHGVGFRAMTKQLADQLHLKGFVRNMADGTVEICAQGDKGSLKKLIGLLHEEFDSSYIQKMDIVFQPVKEPYFEFKVQR